MLHAMPRAVGLCVVTLFAALAACAGTPKIATETDALDALRMRWVAAFNTRQTHDIGTMYAMDAVYIPISGNRVVSATAIENLFSRIWTRFEPHVVLEPHAIERRGDLAYESGDYRESVSATEGSLDIAGAYAFVYRHEATGWMFVTQVWTERTPQPDASAQ